MMKLGSFLGVGDYMVIIGSLVACVSVGIYHQIRRRHGQKIEDYFLGGRKMPIVPIALSMVATTISAVPLVSGTGEMYRYGMEYIFLVFGMQLGKILAVYTIIPVFRYLDYISIYEYFERRFDRSVRILFSGIYILMNVFQTAVVLYLPTLLMTVVTAIPYWIMAAFFGIVCTVYCIIGGFRTVVWTDVIQLTLMFISMVAIIAVGAVAAGGISVVWKTAFVDAFFANLRWVDTEEKRFTVIPSMIFGFFLSMQNFATNQAVVQRLLSVVDIKAAQRSVFVNTIIGFAFAFLLVTGAASIFTLFENCDPMLKAKETGVTSLDLVLLYYLQQYFSAYPFLSGIVLAGILSSSLSTISSVINAFAAITMEDILRPIITRKNVSQKKIIFFSKWLTAFYGALVTLLSFVIPFMGGGLRAMVSILGSIGGPLSGFMFLGIFVARAEKRASLIGLVSGIAICLWLTIGSLTHRPQLKTLPLSIEGCPYSNNGTEMDVVWQKSLTNLSLRNATNIDRSKFSPYKLSFVWFGPIGIVITFVIGLILSYLQSDKSAAVDPQLLSPLANIWKRKENKPFLPVPQSQDKEDDSTHDTKEDKV